MDEETIVEISGSATTHGVFSVSDDINDLVPIADFLRDHPDDLMSVTVADKFFAVGTGLDLTKPFNRAVEWFNPEGNQVTFGTEGNDTLIGNFGNNTLVGGGGDDEFIATTGNDIILGGDGNLDKVKVLAPGVDLEDLSFDFDGPNEVFVYHEPSGTEQEWQDIEFLEINGSTHAMTEFFV